MNRYYEYHHVVGFEETNLVGNVYYVNYIRWQGQCREMFLLEHAPDVLDEIRGNIRLFVLSSECEFRGELTAFDRLSIRMRVSDLTQTQVAFTFEYVRLQDDVEVLAARGQQRIACMREEDGHTVPVRVPESLRRCAAEYLISSRQADSALVRSNRGGRA